MWKEKVSSKRNFKHQPAGAVMFVPRRERDESWKWIWSRPPGTGGVGSRVRRRGAGLLPMWAPCSPGKITCSWSGSSCRSCWGEWGIFCLPTSRVCSSSISLPGISPHHLSLFPFFHMNPSSEHFRSLFVFSAWCFFRWHSGRFSNYSPTNQPLLPTWGWNNLWACPTPIRWGPGTPLVDSSRFAKNQITGCQFANFSELVRIFSKFLEFCLPYFKYKGLGFL